MEVLKIMSYVVMNLAYGALAHLAHTALPWFPFPYGDPGEKEERDEKGKVVKKPNGAYYSPCELCELKDDCTKGEHRVCDVLCAESGEYFYDAGELVIDKKGKMRVEKWLDI